MNSPTALCPNPTSSSAGHEHNLRDVNLMIPRNQLVVFTGVSGSEKSSLAFDTLYAEGQRCYVESLSSYDRQFLGQMPKPEVTSINEPATDEPPFSLRVRLASFRFAMAGIATMIRTQHNARVHLVITLLVLIAGGVLSVSAIEWCLLIMAITMVWVAEMFNTAIEAVCDVAHPEMHPLIKRAKDISAATVLVSALGAAAVGLIVFVPHVVALLTSPAL